MRPWLGARHLSSPSMGSYEERLVDTGANSLHISRICICADLALTHFRQLVAGTLDLLPKSH